MKGVTITKDYHGNPACININVKTFSDKDLVDDLLDSIETSKILKSSTSEDFVSFDVFKEECLNKIKKSSTVNG